MGSGTSAVQMSAGISTKQGPGRPFLAVEKARRMTLGSIDGSVTLVLGTVDLSATRTSLAMVAAEALGVDLADVRAVVGDTDMVAYSGASAGDKVTYVTSKAIIKASNDLLQQLKIRVAAALEAYEMDVRALARHWERPTWDKPASPCLSSRLAPGVQVTAERTGRVEAAEAYLKYLYSDEGQAIVAKHYYRPRSASVAVRFADRFPKVELFTIDEVFGGWAKAQKTHFDDGGLFDQLYQPKK